MADEALVPGSKNPQEQDEHTRKHGIGSTLLDFFTEHKMLVIGIIGGTAIVALVMAKSQSSANSANTANTGAANQQGSLAGNQDANTASALTNLQTQINNMRDTISTIAQGPAGPAGPTGPQGPAGPSGTLPSTGWKPPLIQQGAWPSNFKWQFGQKVGFGGVSYTVSPGNNGIIWGVPNFKGTLAQWNAVPIGTGPGQKVAVYSTNPASYKAPALNAQANHSPMYNYMALSRSAGAMQDLSHPGLSGSPLSQNPVSRIGHTWNYQ